MDFEKFFDEHGVELSLGDVETRKGYEHDLDLFCTDTFCIECKDVPLDWRKGGPVRYCPKCGCEYLPCAWCGELMDPTPPDAKCSECDYTTSLTTGDLVE